MRDTSLVFPVASDGRILLGRKRRGMGYGKWNGFGGKIEAGETMRECAARELFEECGLTVRPERLTMVGDLYFHQPSDTTWSHAGIIYLAQDWSGTPHLSDEMEPRWFHPKSRIKPSITAYTRPRQASASSASCTSETYDPVKK